MWPTVADSPDSNPSERHTEIRKLGSTLRNRDEPDSTISVLLLMLLRHFQRQTTKFPISRLSWFYSGRPGSEDSPVSCATPDSQFVVRQRHECRRRLCSSHCRASLASRCPRKSAVAVTNNFRARTYGIGVFGEVGRFFRIMPFYLWKLK